MKKAVIYARYSSNGQTEQSIEGQIRRCKEFAQANNLLIVNEYIDRARTATNNNRPAFQQMLFDSAFHKFDFVIVYAVDRFSRNDIDYNIDKKTLLTNGVNLLSATESIGVNADGSENLGGILTEGILVAVAKYFSRELSKKVKRGQFESLQKGTFLGGKHLYGYKVENKKILKDKQQAEVVQMIFDLYLSGESTIDIALLLKEQGIYNNKGNPFSHNTIMWMLKNKKYIGIFNYGNYSYTNYYPPIIEKEKFDMVQKLIENNKYRPARAKAKTDYLLSGKLFCGYCKSHMNGESGTSHTGTIHNYYKCSNRKGSKGCHKKTIKKLWIEDLVINATINYILTPTTIQKISTQIIQLQENNREQKVVDIIKQELNQTNMQIKNLIDAIKQGIYTNSTKEELQTLEAKKESLQEKLEMAEYTAEHFITKEMVEHWMRQFINFSNSEQDRKNLVTYFVHKVIAYDDKIIIIYNHYGNNTKEIDINEIEEIVKHEDELCLCKHSLHQREWIDSKNINPFLLQQLE